MTSSPRCFLEWAKALDEEHDEDGVGVFVDDDVDSPSTSMCNTICDIKAFSNTSSSPDDRALSGHSAKQYMLAAGKQHVISGDNRLDAQMRLQHTISSSCGALVMQVYGPGGRRADEADWGKGAWREDMAGRMKGAERET